MKKVEEFFVYKVRNLLECCAMLRLNDDCPMDIAKLSHFGADAKKPGSSIQLFFCGKVVRQSPTYMTSFCMQFEKRTWVIAGSFLE